MSNHTPNPRPTYRGAILAGVGVAAVIAVAFILPSLLFRSSVPPSTSSSTEPLAVTSTTSFIDGAGEDARNRAIGTEGDPIAEHANLSARLSVAAHAVNDLTVGFEELPKIDLQRSDLAPLLAAEGLTVVEGAATDVGTVSVAATHGRFVLASPTSVVCAVVVGVFHEELSDPLWGTYVQSGGNAVPVLAAAAGLDADMEVLPPPCDAEAYLSVIDALNEDGTAVMDALSEVLLPVVGENRDDPGMREALTTESAVEYLNSAVGADWGFGKFVVVPDAAEPGLVGPAEIGIAVSSVSMHDWVVVAGVPMGDACLHLLYGPDSHAPSSSGRRRLNPLAVELFAPLSNCNPGGALVREAGL